ncbi:MAG: hypothetical protein GXO78_14655 [Calditrichaeota bacterium]|nr:hypothetical protein [Calditrichota bacterium]
MNLVLPFAISLVAALLAVHCCRMVAYRYRIGSFPTARSMHQEFKPVLGGLGIFLAILISLIVASGLRILPWDVWITHYYFFVGWLAIVFTGALDDVVGLSSWQKFLGEFMAAVLIVLGGCVIEAFVSPGGATLNLGWLAYPFTVLWIIFIINALNLLDGLDGLAGGISLIALIGFAIISYLQHNLFLLILSISAIGAVLGFLRFNYHPAKIFMGDVGSLQLGYLLAFFSIEALRVARSHQVYFLASLVLLGVPVTDTLISFFRRLGRGESPFKPDKEHVHHRLLKLGLSHLHTVWLLYVVAFFYMVLGVLMVVYLEVTGYVLFTITFVTSIYWARRLGYMEAYRRYPKLDVQPGQTHQAPPLHLNRLWHQVFIFLSDLVAVNLALYFTYWFKFQSGWVSRFTIRALQDYLMDPVFLFFTIGWVLLFWLNGLYSMPWDVGRFEKTLRVTRVITFGIVLVGFLTTDPSSPLNASQLTTLVFYWFCMVVFVNGGRLGIIELEKRKRIFEYSMKNTLLIGATRQARNLLRDIRNNPHLLYDVKGIVVKKKGSVHEFEGLPILGEYRDLPNLIQQLGIEEIIIAVPENSRTDLLNIISICDRFHVVMKTTPALHHLLSGSRSAVDDHSLTRVFPERMVPWQWIVKRGFDILFALVNLVINVPLVLGAWGLISWQFKRFPVTSVAALGKFGQPFRLYVFRMGRQIPERYYFGEGRASRLSPLGKFLFRTRFYKFPQIFNILKGEMSVVGPRPESPDWYRRNEQRFRFLHRRLFVRPGLTGLAQVRYRYESGQKYLEERIKSDIYYIENLSLRLDFQIIIRSILLLIQRRVRLF